MSKFIKIVSVFFFALSVAIYGSLVVIPFTINTVNAQSQQAISAGTAIAEETATQVYNLSKSGKESEAKAQQRAAQARAQILATFTSAYQNAKSQGQSEDQAIELATQIAEAEKQTILSRTAAELGIKNTNSTPPNSNTGSHTQPTDKPTNGEKGGFVPCGNTADNPCQIGHLFSAFVVIINYLIAMAGFVAVLAIVYAGFMMVYSQGQEQLKAAKGRFSGAIIGLVLVAAAFVLVNALFTGNLSVGVKDGASILANPLEYINR